MASADPDLRAESGKAPPERGDPGVRRFAMRFGAATLVAQLAQVAWLIGGSRTMTPAVFGTVLAAQALYGVLQIVIDNGPAWHGARLAAAGSLDDASRGSIVRVRLQLCVPAAAAGLAIGVIGGKEFFWAVVPFMVALFLFALMNYWESFGVGDPAPWSGYLVLRSLAPALAVGLVHVSGHSFPAVLAGIIECGVIIGVAVGFRLRPVPDLWSALRATRGPWRSVSAIGLTSLVGQATLAAGVLLFTVTGSPAAAAILAVSVRLLTGLNGVSGVVGTALYPRLADNATRLADDRAYVATALRVILSLVMAAAGVYLLGASLFMTVLLGTSDEQAVGTGTLTMLAAGASGYGLLVVTVLFARNREAFALGANVVGFLVTLVGSVVVIVAGTGFR